MKYKIEKIISTDYVSILLLSLPIVLFIFFLFSVFDIPLKSKSGIIIFIQENVFLIPVIFSTLISTSLVIFRVKRIAHILVKGDSADGIVTSSTIFRDRGSIEFEYVVGNQLFKKIVYIGKNPRTTGLSVKNKVEVKYLKSNPKRAYITSIYNL